MIAQHQNALFNHTGRLQYLTLICHYRIKLTTEKGADEQYLFISETKWRSDDLLNTLLVATNLKLELTRHEYVISKLLDPAEDTQSEQWFSYVSSPEESDENAYFPENFKSNVAYSWHGMSGPQKKALLSAAEYSKPKTSYLTDPKNSDAITVRCCTGAKIVIAYYSSNDSSSHPSFVNQHAIEVPLFDPWVSMDFLDWQTGDQS